MYQILAYLNYWLRAVDEHSLHSPFLFDFYKAVVNDNHQNDFEEIESIRRTLIKDFTPIHFKDLGAGSRLLNSNKRTIAQITRHSSTPSKFSRLLFRLIQRQKSKTILELGTSLGINTLYMNMANPDSFIYTFEGVSPIAERARQNFDLASNNIELIEGNIDQTLPNFLKSSKIIDLVYIDANHNYASTTHYFNLLMPHINNNSIVVIDDIHWSKGMNKAWTELKNLNDVTISIDLFEAGILMFNEDFPKTDITLKY